MSEQKSKTSKTAAVVDFSGYTPLQLRMYARAKGISSSATNREGLEADILNSITEDEARAVVDDIITASDTSLFERIKPICGTGQAVCGKYVTKGGSQHEGTLLPMYPYTIVDPEDNTAKDYVHSLTNMFQSERMKGKASLDERNIIMSHLTDASLQKFAATMQTVYLFPAKPGMGGNKCLVVVNAEGRTMMEPKVVQQKLDSGNYSTTPVYIVQDKFVASSNGSSEHKAAVAKATVEDPAVNPNWVV